MARCPFCNEILEDDWVKKIGATLMGKTSGERKARGTASAAATKRWTLHDDLQKARDENLRLREQLKLSKTEEPPKKKKRVS